MTATEPGDIQAQLKLLTAASPSGEIANFVDHVLRPLLGRTIAVFQGKGGQGKTSIATHTSALLAEAEAAKAAEGQQHSRVLIVELDSQGNCHEDLGTGGHALNDRGESLSNAILFGQQPQIIRDVRPCLDMIPSGSELENLPAMITAVTQKRGQAAWLGLAATLASVADQYSWIILDCPPSSREPQMLALAAARWVVVPVSVADSGSINGLGGVAKRFQEADMFNPDLELLGVVLFAFTHQYRTDPRTGEKRPVGAWVKAREEVKELLASAGSDAPVFRTVIRKSESVAKASRSRGQLAWEVGESTDGVPWWQKVRTGAGTVLPTDRADQVGRDYEDLAVELVEHIFDREDEEAAATETDDEVMPA